MSFQWSDAIFRVRVVRLITEGIKNCELLNTRCHFLCEGCTTENEMCKKPMVSRNWRSVSHAICGTGRHWVGCTWLGGLALDI